MTTDITFCTNQTCPIKGKCKRGLDVKGERLSFSRWEPVKVNKEWMCEAYYPFKQPDKNEY